MAKKTLVIESDNLERFFLAVQSGTLQVGDIPSRPEGTVEGLRVVRIRCEVEVDEDRDSFSVDQEGVIAPQVLRAGSEVRLKHAHLGIQSTAAESSPGTALAMATAAESPTSVPLATGPKRLKVTDGGDQGRSFPLPDAGTVSVGKAGGPVEIGLHDLYVAKVHCTLTIDNDIVRVAHVEGQHGTLIDNQKITQPQALRPGSVLRVGNSHLRLEVGPYADEPVPQTASTKNDGSGVSRPLPTDGSGVTRAARPGSKPATPVGEDPLVTLVEQTLGQYHINRLLGRGHSGAVFHATNQKTDQAVALKVFAPEFPASPAELERFALELRVAQPIRHANLVALLGAGKATAHCWIAREFVEGESAAAVIARIAEGEKPSWTRAARLVVHLARALDHLRQHRLVHGNITPRNVLLQMSDHATKLTDLRLAEMLVGSQLQQRMAEKKRLAELPFLAPEQVEAGGFVDSLADLYAVGALAYALCTGRPPVAGQSPADIRDHILNGRVSKPSLVYKKVPPAFDAVVLKLLARHQEDRYQSASAVLTDLAPIAASHDLKL